MSYSKKEVVDNAYQLLFYTGIFAEDCREWDKRVADNKTLPHLKVSSAAAHREWRLSIKNETGAPYGAAHNATTNPDNKYLHQETVDVIANLVRVTASDCGAITHLTTTVVRLTTKLLMVNVKLIVALQSNRASQGGCGGHDRTSCGREAGAGSRTGKGAGAPARTGAGAPSMSEEKYLEPPIQYFWTCVPRCRHNSAKCPAPSTGHVYTATKRNMQVGEEAYK